MTLATITKIKTTLLALITSATAAIAGDYSDIEGYWSITSYSSFEGCEYDKYIDLGSFLFQCREYDYEYHYGSMTVLGTKYGHFLCAARDLDDAVELYIDDDCHRGKLYNK